MHILGLYLLEFSTDIEQLKLKRNNLSNDLDSAHATRQQVLCVVQILLFFF